MSRKRKSTFGLRLDQLADIFAVAAKDKAPTEADRADKRLAEMLRRQLTEVIPGNSLLFSATSEVSATRQCDLTSLTGRSLLQALFSPESGVSQLQAVKEASKRLTTTLVFETERAEATTIYHAAIASCLVHHDKKITQHSYDKLDESFALLIEKKWMAQELIELFSRARRICQSKRRKK
ncbi:MAG: hypothetical protein ACETWQ_10225 [Phycisphaerae bacterium]